MGIKKNKVALNNRNKLEISNEEESGMEIMKVTSANFEEEVLNSDIEEVMIRNHNGILLDIKGKIKKEELLARKRTKEVAQARQIAMYLSKQLTNNSLATIGKTIGQRDHATVMHACNVVSDQMDIDKNFRLTVQEIESKLKS